MGLNKDVTAKQLSRMLQSSHQLVEHVNEQLEVLKTAHLCKACIR